MDKFGHLRCQYHITIASKNDVFYCLAHVFVNLNNSENLKTPKNYRLGITLVYWMGDIEHDWDVDVLVSRVTLSTTTHALMINDGAGGFTDEEALLPP